MLGACQGVAHVNLLLVGHVPNALDERVLVRLEHDRELEIQHSIQCLASRSSLCGRIAVCYAE